jgi:hypothetical protein
MTTKDTLLSAKWVRKKKEKSKKAKAKTKIKTKTKTQPKLTLLLQLPITYRCLTNLDKQDPPDQKTHP